MLYPLFSYKDCEDKSIYNDSKKQMEIIGKIEKMDFDNEKIIKDKKALARWYVKAWFKDIPIIDLLKELQDILIIKIDFINMVLIGTHGYSSNGSDRKKYSINPDEFVEDNNRKKLINIIKKTIEEDGEKSIIAKVITTKYGILPNFGRKETFLLKSGKYPFFFPNYIVDDAEVYKNCHLNIDVSGSFENELPFIYKLIKSIKLYISEPIYIFSDIIEEIRISELKVGKVKTTFGTDFSIVFKHALDNKFKKILIITDGQDYERNCEILDRVKKENIEIFVVLLRECMEHKNYFNKTGIAKKSGF